MALSKPPKFKLSTTGQTHARARPAGPFTARNVTETSPLANAHQAIGEYFAAFSRVEHELGESVKAVLGLENNDTSDAIVAALWDFFKKANLVWAASKGAKKDGSEASAEWKDKVEATIKRVLECNNDRVRLAHSLLQPNGDGSVDLVQHLKLDRRRHLGAFRRCLLLPQKRTLPFATT